MGVACGSATAFSDDLASEDFIQELIHEVTIENFRINPLREENRVNINDLLIKDVMIMDLQATDKKARLMKWSKIIRWWPHL